MDCLLDNSLVVVQSLSHVRLFVTPWTVAHLASLSFTISWSVLKLTSIELVMPSNLLILGHSFLLLPSIFPSIRVLPMSSWHQFSSVQFSRSVVSDSLQPHESQHTRPPCPSPTPGVLLWTKSGPLLLFTNKVLLKHSLIHSFAYHLWLLHTIMAEF